MTKTNAALLIFLLVVISFETYFLFQFGLQIEAPSSTPSPSHSPVPTFAQTPIATPSPIPSYTPTPISTPVPQATGNSQNWAGYAILSNLSKPQPIVVMVSATWIVPSVQPSSTDTHSGVWIGIGGYGTDDTLVQAGTQQDSVRGRTRYSAWFEILPDQHVLIPQLNVGEGHEIHAAISLNDPLLNQWTIDLVDVSTGQEFHKTLLYNSSRLSAEWIVERPTINASISSLANFGNVTFTDCEAALGNRTGSIGVFPNVKFSMFQSIRPATGQLVDVGNLYGSGAEFTMSYI